MAEPSKYSPSYSFTGFQTQNPISPLPAPRLDEQFHNISKAIGDGADAVNDIRRSDGRLKNGIVTPEALSPSLTIGFSMQGQWSDGERYAAGDGVVHAQKFYTALVSHTATAANEPGVDSATWAYLFSVDDLVVAGAASFYGASYVGDGATKTFALPIAPASPNNLWVKIGTVVQSVTAYAVSGTTATLATPPAIGASVEFRVLATIGVQELEDGVYTARDTAVAKAAEAAGSALAAAGSASAAAASAASAQASATTSAQDRVATGQDRTQTGLDRAFANSAKDTAVAARDTAVDAKDTAVAAKDTAASKAADAALSASSALTSEVAAYKWAQEAEDTPVVGVLYSAFHWAHKAAKAVTGNIGGAIASTVSKSAPDDSDRLGFASSTDGWSLRYLTWANLKAVIASATMTMTNKTFVDPIIVGADPWASRPIGEPVAVLSSIAGVSAPPKDKSYRYVLLTAGQTGVGAYNEGILTGEIVTGSAPLVVATAVVNLAGSPINGQTIQLINTERRFLRAGSAGTIETDAFQGHWHTLNTDNGLQGGSGTTYYGKATSNNTANSGVLDPRTDGVNGAPRTANETRSKNIGVTYYMRIK
ncbi:hypothetical protein M2281_001624 [Mesorhizobium soli]|uniref:carbohydrate-binding protein n=1 Tax=Pseudaminobacter soli (ex Li et al. 2025) TaxID=1295366 RepID=UPI002475036D|nr:carbohydrate-binding protein [Mesorhizobium soli]MDH6231052.1 hypothetical protein [Mesorhizobium soli]